MAYAFSPQTEKDFQWLITRYPNKNAILLPLLHKVQAETGYLHPEAIEYVASRMDLSPARVREVASFYTMFKLNDKGKYVVQVCHNLSCYLRGSDELIEKIKSLLGVEEGEITPDGKFSVERVECLASCSTAPVVQVNDWDYHENMTLDKVEKVIQGLKDNRGAHESFEKRVSEGSVA